MVDGLYGTGWRVDDRQGNDAGAVRLTGFSFWRISAIRENLSLLLVHRLFRFLLSFFVTHIFLFGFTEQ